jgi:aminoglycoside 6'-N-acetyltransferase I
LIRIRHAEPGDWCQLAVMRALLWPDASEQEHLAEVEAGQFNPGQSQFPFVALVADDERGELLGFLEVGLRSHADGCDTRQPVGFVEGWFVREGHRGQGVGRELMHAAEEWARSQGCLEMASDALIDNSGSEGAHMALGFEIVDRCIHFRKALRTSEG